MGYDKFIIINNALNTEPQPRRHVVNTVKFIGMDVHKNSITTAIADGGNREPARVYGTINNDFEALSKFCRKKAAHYFL